MREVRDRVGRALKEVLGDGTSLSCRFTHVYPDGPAPYYSFSGVAKLGGEAQQWREIKDAASNAVVDCGGTVTHHHAVGRLHRPAWERQRPPLFAEALRAIKESARSELDSEPGCAAGLGLRRYRTSPSTQAMSCVSSRDLCRSARSTRRSVALVM